MRPWGVGRTGGGRSPRGDEYGPQVGGQDAVEFGDRGLGKRREAADAHVVDDDIQVAPLFEQPCDAGLERPFVADIHPRESGSRRCGGGCSGLGVAVAECDTGTRMAECLDDGASDAPGASRDEDAPSGITVLDTLRNLFRSVARRSVPERRSFIPLLCHDVRCFCCIVQIYGKVRKIRAAAKIPLPKSGLRQRCNAFCREKAAFRRVDSTVSSYLCSIMRPGGCRPAAGGGHPAKKRKSDD